MDLGGTWRAAVADERLRRTFAERDAPDDEWVDIDVPGHWRRTPGFGDTDGPILFRRRFEADAPGAGERAWLVFDGIFYVGDVWLDGAYLGDTEGYFIRHTFEVTEPLRASSEHALAVEVTCSRPDDRTAKRNITGFFQHGADPRWNPGGIWRPARVERTGPVRARSLRMLCRDATTERAVVALRAELDSDAARTVSIRTEVGGHVDVTEHPVAEGSNFVEWSVIVPEPELWWPHSLGNQPMHDVTVAVDVDGRASHVVERRIGLRSLAWHNWTLAVNGERLFLKGATNGPTRLALADATADELRADVAVARDAGLDLLRVHAHVSRPELYDAADELGVLLWQDLPLRFGHARGIRKQAARQAAAAVDTLGHHPSIAIWCGHDSPVALDNDPSRRPSARTVARWVVGQQLPTWNKTLLDTSVKRAFEKADGTRPVVAHSGVMPSPGSGGTDSHLWFGWYHGDERDLPGFARALPRMVRFVSAFGAQSVPPNDDDLEPGSWSSWDWTRLDVLAHRLPPEDSFDYETWKAATQAYQATLVKHHVETLRLLKWRPTGGFTVQSLGDALDGGGVISWSMLDHRRTPKPAYLALVEACRSVIVVAERPPETLTSGEALALDIHVVSDERVRLPDARVEAALRWSSGSHTWKWQGDVAADECTYVGTLQAVVPDEPGELSLDLVLVAGDRAATNRYTSTIVQA